MNTKYNINNEINNTQTLSLKENNKITCPHH